MARKKYHNTPLWISNVNQDAFGLRSKKPSTNFPGGALYEPSPYYPLRNASVRDAISGRDRLERMEQNRRERNFRRRISTGGKGG